MKIDNRVLILLTGVILFVVGVVIGMRTTAISADAAAEDIIKENQKVWAFTLSQYETLSFASSICRKLTVNECAIMIDAHRDAIRKFVIQNFEVPDSTENRNDIRTAINRSKAMASGAGS